MGAFKMLITASRALTQRKLSQSIALTPPTSRSATSILQPATYNAVNLSRQALPPSMKVVADGYLEAFLARRTMKRDLSAKSLSMRESRNVSRHSGEVPLSTNPETATFYLGIFVTFMLGQFVLETYAYRGSNQEPIFGYPLF